MFSEIIGVATAWLSVILLTIGVWSETVWVVTAWLSLILLTIGACSETVWVVIVNAIFSDLILTDSSNSFRLSTNSVFNFIISASLLLNSFSRTISSAFKSSIFWLSSAFIDFFLVLERTLSFSKIDCLTSVKFCLVKLLIFSIELNEFSFSSILSFTSA